MTATKVLDKLSPYRSVLMLLVVLFLASHLTACSNFELIQSVNNSASILEAPGGGMWIIYGSDPSGHEWIATVRLLTSGFNYSAGQLNNLNSTVTITEDLSKMGWRVIPFSSLPGIVQVFVLSKIEAAAPLVEQMSANTASRLPVISIFGLPSAFYTEFVKEDCRYTADGYTCDL